MKRRWVEQVEQVCLCLVIFSVGTVCGMWMTFGIFTLAETDAAAPERLPGVEWHGRRLGVVLSSFE